MSPRPRLPPNNRNEYDHSLFRNPPPASRMNEIGSSPITRRAALERLALMMGGAVAAPLMAGVLGGCQASGPEPPQLLLLDDDQYALVTRLTDHILPATDTPGASEVGVPGFIDKMLAEWYDDEDRDVFLLGLADIEARAQYDHGRTFIEMEPAQQVALMQELDDAAYGVTRPATATPEDVAEAAQQGTDAMQREREAQMAGGTDVGGDPQAAPPPPDFPDGPRFFRMLKELTLTGYYTSKVGMTQELQWLPAPGRYDGDAPLSEIGRTWA